MTLDESEGCQSITRSNGSDDMLDHYINMIDSVSDALISIDESGLIRTWNKAAESIYDYKAEEVIGKPIVETLRTEFFGTDLEHVTKFVDEKGRWQGEVIQKKRDGTPVSILSSVYYLKKKSGGSMLLVAVNHDLTDIKMKDTAIKAGEQRLFSIIENAPEAIGIARNGGVIYGNPNFLKMFGYSDQNDLFGRPINDHICHQDRERVLSTVDAYVQGHRGSKEMEFMGMRKDGSRVPVHLSITMVDLDYGPALVGFFTDITKRKLAEEEMKTSQNMLQLVLDNIPDRVFWKDLDLKYLGANMNTALDAGLSDPTEIVGKNDIELAWKETTEMYQADDRAVIASGLPKLKFEEPQVGKDGKVRWLRTSKLPLRDPTGRIIGVLGTYEDITERKKNENDLAESERRLLTLMNNLPGMAYRCKNDRDWTMEFLSEGCENLTGFSSKEVVVNNRLSPASLATLILPEHRVHVWEDVQSALKDRRPFKITYELRTASGEIRWVWEQGEGVFSPEGTVIALEGFIIDITERMHAEEALRRKTEELDHFFTNNLDLVCITDIDGTFRRLNKEWERVLGYSLKEIQGKQFLELVHPDDLEGTLNAMTMLSDQDVTLNFINRFRCKDGSYRWIEWRSYPEGRMIYAVARDVTDRKRVEEELRRSNEELQQFAYIASHDLQEPLRMVISYLSLLERRSKEVLDPDAREYLRFAADGGRRMRELIDDILTYSRVETADKEFLPVEMDAVVSETLEVLGSQIEAKRIDVQVDPMPSIYADRTQMQQLMQNLISNAIKYNNADQPKIHISVSVGDGEWVFSVKDNGIGLNMDYAEKIFQMFQRLHTRDEIPGTGVGLAISKKIVERHGGRIWVESEEGKGATFFFTIPNKRCSRLD